MRIVQYSSRLDENGGVMLVKQNSVNYPPISKVNCPEAVAEIMMNVFNIHKQAEEFVYMLCINNAGKLLGVFEISHGSVNNAICNPREIFLKGLLCNASSIIMVHNHPGGDVEPSTTDIETFLKIKKAGELLNVPLSDSIIISSDGIYCSMAERGLIG